MRISIIFVTVALAMALCFPVLAQTPGDSPIPTPTPSAEPGPTPPSPDDIPTLPDILETIAGPTGWVILGAVFSTLFASWKWYNQQSSAIKRGMPVVAAIVVSIIARVLLTYIPTNFWGDTAEYWYIIAGALLTWLGSQGWFAAVVKPNRG
jgi:hypothetical protein